MVPTEELRDLDEFLESAYTATPETYVAWRYWLVILSLGMANASDATEILSMSFLLPNESFQESILGGHAGMLSSSIFLGMLTGGLLAGPLGDVFGRRILLLYGLALDSVAGLCAVFAPNVYFLSLARCVGGLGIGCTIPPLFALATELAPPSARGRCVSICAGFWTVGNLYVVLAAVMTLQQERNWRWFAFLCVVPSIVGWLLVFKFVPRSPRFLGLRGDITGTVKVINNLARRMSMDDGVPLEPWTTREAAWQFGSSPSSRLMPTGTTDENIPMMGTSSSFIKTTWDSAKQFWVAAGFLYKNELFRTTWTLKSLWFVLGFASYGLIMWINTLFKESHLENIYLNAFIFALSNIPGNAISIFMVDHYGRVSLLIGSILISAAALVSFAYLVTLESVHTVGIVASACVFQCCNVVSWSIVDVMTGEMFPTKVRSTGVGMCAMSTRVAAVVAQIVNSSLAKKPSVLLLVSSSVLLIGAIAPCLLPSDMTGKSVKDMITEPCGCGEMVLSSDESDTSDTVSVAETEVSSEYKVALELV